MRNTAPTRGFTLVEIMLVVLIIGLLMMIAIPSWLHARSQSRTQAVLSNLRQVFTAKEQFSMEHGLVSGANVNDAADLCPKYLPVWPTGPIPGAYAANVVGAEPTFNGQNADWYALHCSPPTADAACTLN